MPSSSPLNSHPQDAVAGHNAKSGVGGLQHAAGTRHGEHALIERGYVPVRQLTGTVVGVWGDAHIRLLNGEVVPLHVGDVVKKGEVVLTAQDGIIQIEASHTQFGGASDDVERLITQVGQGDADVAPAAGPNSGGAAGSLEEGLRVDRDAESVTPGSLAVNPVAAAPQPTEQAAVAPLAVAPVANPDTETTAANQPVVFDPRANDTPSTGLTIVAVAGHAISAGNPVTLPHGTVSLNADGTLTFTPSHDFNGSLSFTYTDASPTGATATSTVTVNVGNLSNQVPEAVADNVAAHENTPVSGNLGANDTPVPGETNTWAVATPPAHGQVALNPDGTYTYTPAAGFSGTDTFTYTLTDAAGQASTATVTLTVAPTTVSAVSATATATENGQVAGNLGGDATQVPSDPNTFALGTGPAHGTVVVNPDGSYTYTPSQGYSGFDSFSYTVTDHSGATSTATVTLTVNALPVNAGDTTNAGAENNPISGSLASSVSTVLGDPNTFTAGTTTTPHGSVTINADGSYTYTPNPGYSGPDSFTYTVTDASGQTSTATVSLTVTPQAIAASPGSATVNENDHVGGTLAGDVTQVAGDVNTFTAGTTATPHGSVTINADGSYTYTPTVGYSGPDSFTYTVTDHSGQTSTSTVTLTVAPLPMTAGAATNTGTENSPIGGSVATDVNTIPGDPSTFTAGTTTTPHGSVTINVDGSYTYTPTQGYSGPDSFTYTVTDASGQTSTATVNITVGALPVTATNDTNTVNENGALTNGSLTKDVTGPAGDTLTFTAGTTATAHGSVAINADGSYSYTPTQGYSGPDSFTYTVTDHSGQTTSATINLTVNPLPITAANGSNSGNENGTISGGLAGDVTLIAGDPNTFTAGTTVTPHGSVTIDADGSYVYTPTTGYSGPDSFSYTVTDKSGQTATAMVSLSVNPLGYSASPDTKSGNENSAISGSVASDVTQIAGETNHFAEGSVNPSNGSVVVNPDGSYTYTPNAGFSGTDSFSYTATNTSGQVASATVTITVVPLPVTATNDTASVNENVSIANGSLTKDVTAPTGETLTFTAGTTATAHGSVTINADGSYAYTPAQGYSGPDSFSYTVTDKSGQTSTATVNLTVAALPVTATGDTNSVNENASITNGSLTKDVTAPAGDALTFTAGTTATAHGSVTISANGSYTYTPAQGYSGPDSFTYTVTDKSGQTSTATVNLTVAALPVAATNDTASVNENASITNGSLTRDVTSPTGDTLTFTAGTTATAHGSVTINADGSYSYTPNQGYSGPDSFSYTVTDKSGQTSTAAVNITVAALPVTATNDTNSVNENASITNGSLTKDVTVPTGDTLTFTAGTTVTAHGSVTINANGSYTYTPTQGYSGPDSFSYTVTDKSGQTSTATVNVTVAALPVTAANDANSVSENSAITNGSLTKDVTGPTGDALTFTAGTTATAHGSVIIDANGSYTYTPTQGYSGPDSFSYTVTDKSGQTSTATVTLSVNPLGYSASPDTKSGNENSAISGSVASDVTQIAGETSHFAGGSLHPSNGSVLVNPDGSYTYTPNAGFSGTDSFSYTATNTSGQVASATVTITVVPLPVTATNDTNSVNENASITNGSLTKDVTGPTGDTLTFTAGTTATAHGSVTVNADGSYSYTPNQGYSGPDSFSYTATDKSGQTSTATVNITVAALPVTATNDTNSVNENASITNGSLTKDVTVPTGDTLTFTAGTTATAHGSVTINANGSYTYTPTQGYSGPDSFSYTATDKSGQTSTATVNITVAALPVTATNDTNSVNENASITNGSLTKDVAAPTGDTLTFTAGTTATAHGSVTISANGGYTYTPTQGYSGPDSFSYTVTDKSGQTSTATVNLTVAALPVMATGDTNSVNENASITNGSLTRDVTGPTGDTLTFTAGTTATAHGSVTINANGSYTYTPTQGYSGADSFTYAVTDKSGQTSTATVNITVAPLPVTATNDSNSVNENASITSGSLTKDVTGPTGDALTFTAGTTATAHGSVTINANGSYTYTPTQGYSGTDSFSYTVTDKSGQTSTASVNITVAALPVAATNDTNSVNENSAVTDGSLTKDVTGPTGDALAFTAGTTATGHGSVTINANGSYTYTPTQGYSGPDSFSYTVTDKSGQTSTATVNITVAALPVTATSDTNTVAENASITNGSLTKDVTGPTGDALTFTAGTTATAHGSVTISANGSYTYTPNQGYSGSDSFSYTVTDKSGQTSTATITVGVAPLPVTASNDTNSVSENASITNGSLTKDAAGPTGDALTFTAGTTATAHGSVSINANGNYTYTPTQGYSGADSFTYTVTDKSGQASTATVNITVAALPVTATNDASSVNENASITSASLAKDVTGPTGDALTFTAGTTATAHGSVTISADGNYTYTPTQGYSGTDTFSYTVTDKSGQTSTAAVTVTVASLPVTASNDTNSVNENASITNGSLTKDVTGPTGDALTFAAGTTATAHGSVTINANGSYTYTPTQGYSGSDSFTYTVTDKSGQTSTASVSITVAALPVAATNDTNSVNENSAVTNGSLTKDVTAPTGDALTFTAGTTATAHGSVTIGTNGSYTYTPAQGYSGADSFTYTVTDKSGQTSTATVNITVAALPVTATNDTNSVNENASIINGSLTKDVAGPTGDTLTFTAGTTATAHGSVTINADGSYTYTPTQGYSGADSFSYTVTDKSGQTSTATVNITVAALPVTATNDTNSVNENASITNGSLTKDVAGPTGDALTFAAGTTATAHGSVTINANGSYTYTPTQGYSGSDSFTYTVTDKSGQTSTATVNITVAALPVTATSDANTVNENASITNGSLTKDVTGPTGDALTFTAGTTATAHGSVTINANGSYTYTPAQGYSGADSFTYTVTDKSGQTSTATVNITVAALPVTATNDSNSVNENASITSGSLTKDVTGPAGDALTFTAATTATAHGSVTISANGNYTYTPTQGYSGTDTFSYTVTDKSGQTSTATVTVTVAPLPVTAGNDTNSVNENASITNGSLTKDVTGPTGDTLAFTAGTTATAHGSVTVNANGSYTYTPNQGYSGSDSFSYTVTDKSGQTSTATVNLTVAPLPVTATNDSNSVEENASITSGSLTKDVTGPTGDTLTFTAGTTATAHGSATISANGSYTYTPTQGYSGTDTFSYTVTDKSGQTSTATITVTVAPLPVTAGNDSNSVNENASIANGSLTKDVAGPTGDALTFTAGTTATAHGSVTIGTNGSYTYTPAQGYSGADSFTYTVTDKSGQTSTATVNITVAALPVTATNDTNSVNENASIINGSLTKDVAGPTGDTLTFTAGTTATAHGSVTINADGSYTYTPTQGYSGADSFTYTVTDKSGQTSTATVNITVGPLPVTATNDSNSVNENASITNGSLTKDVTGPAGDTLTFTAGTTATAHGSVTINANGSYTYTPTQGYSGSDSFTYAVTDKSGQTSTATITVTVAPLPVSAGNDTNAVNEDASIASGSLAKDVTAPTGDALTFTAGTTATAHGSVTINADGSYSYTPTQGYSGTDTFNYTVTDKSGQTSTATVNITVTPIAPIAKADAFTVTANGPSSALSVKTNDTPVAGETNTWSVKTNPAHGTVTPAADFATSGNFVYTPTAGFIGTDTFTYIITDSAGLTSTATVTLTVAAEIAPVANPDSYTATENTLLVLNGIAAAANHAVTSNDTDTNGNPLTVTQINGIAIADGGTVAVTNGTVTMDASGNLLFNPTTNFVGTASYTYTISDGHGGTSTTTDTITVSAGMDIPTVIANSIGRWQFNEGTGTSTTDAYNNVTGTLTDLVPANGGTAPTWVTGHNGTAGTALSFDGKGGVVSVPLANTAVLTTTSSLSVWFKTTQVGSTTGWASPSIIGSEHIGDGNDIQWGTINNNGKIGLTVGDDASGIFSSTAVNDGNWHDLTITRTVNANGSSLVSVYIDGVLSNSGTLAADPAAATGVPTNELAGFGYTNAWSGTTAAPVDGTSGDVYYKGTLDDAAIYSHALTADQAKAIYLVQNGFENQAVANDGDAIKLTVADTHATALHVIGVEAGMTISDGTHTITATSNSQVIDITGWTLGSLQLTNVGTGSANLEFDAINTVGGQTEDESTYLSVVNGTSLIAGTTGNQTLTATSNEATYIVAGTGNDTIIGGNGHDRLIGGAGNDTITGGTGNDLIEGGSGNNTLTGGGGSDVFRWELADHGTAGNAYVDTITDFSASDVLDMRDLLGGTNHTGTNPGNIADFLHFDLSGSDTIIHVSTTGGFANGYSSALENETIVLKGVDLTSNGTETDAQIITQLLTSGQLHLH